MLDNLKKYKIVLASNSPRRRELLQRLGLNFKTRTLFGIDESFPIELKGEEIVRFISHNKALAYKSSMAPDELIITADTMVTVEGVTLGKPKTVEDATHMLHTLSGRTHQVSTGVTVLTMDRAESFAVTTEVKFAKLADDEIDYYVRGFLPLDKAGAYGIQEWLGMVAVEEIRGSYFNVMGLPVQRLYQLLKTF